MQFSKMEVPSLYAEDFLTSFLHSPAEGRAVVGSKGHPQDVARTVSGTEVLLSWWITTPDIELLT